MAPQAMVMKQNGKDLAGENRAGAVGETRERGQLQFRADEQNPDRQHQHHAEFDERAQVIARAPAAARPAARWPGIRRG